MDGRELDYYAELNRDGNLKYLEVSDGEHFYQYGENGGECGVIDLEEENPSSKLEYIKDNGAIIGDLRPTRGLRFKGYYQKMEFCITGIMLIIDGILKNKRF